MVMACPLPLRIVHAQAVNEQQQVRTGIRHLDFQGIGRQRQWHAPHASIHGHGQRVAHGLQRIPEHAVEGRQDGLPLR